MKSSVFIASIISVASVSTALAGDLIGDSVNAKLIAINAGTIVDKPIHEVQTGDQFESPKIVADPDPLDPQTHSVTSEFVGYVTSRYCQQENGEARISKVKVSADVDANTVTV